ncbi:hypothetical protein OG875_28165 [Streptomyces sp. NBC_01498]|uniref:hypothetical protein n=1 Tax=Streptomyces sp. NBC_01498 TaxID=2975870 RepID=UPI002E7C3EFA|nr:hypothetical protein [Streptomyces sp. NBC_01498]WTL28113.1 hypothetical protein OG875_28165 [Streptomyces sp. NBC_01498]
MSSPPPAPPPSHARRGGAGRVVRGVMRLLAAAGLAVDAYLHAHLAEQYDEVTASISQGTLFRIEAGLAALAALLVLVWRRLPADLFAWSVAAGGLALLLIYRYVDVGKLGPFPNMYEPFWYSDKTASVVAEAVAVVATVYLLLFRPRRGGVH